MDYFDRLREYYRAEDECVSRLKDIVNACQWGSGFTPSEIVEQIRKETEQIKKLIDKAQKVS